MIIKSADWFCKTEVYYLSLMEDLINNLDKFSKNRLLKMWLELLEL